MPSGFLWRSRVYRLACAGSFALVLFVIARAPLWSPVMAGARARLQDGHLVLVPPAWQCSDRPYVCSVTVGGGELRVAVDALGERQPMTCSASFRGRAVPCALQLWYAPQLKPMLEIGALPGVSVAAALWERPWRLLDQGLLGETGPLHFHVGCGCAFLLALGAGALIRRGGFWWIARVGLFALVFVALNAAWFMQCFFLGYID